MKEFLEDKAALEEFLTKKINAFIEKYDLEFYDVCYDKDYNKKNLKGLKVRFMA